MENKESDCSAEQSLFGSAEAYSVRILMDTMTG